MKLVLPNLACPGQPAGQTMVKYILAESVFFSRQPTMRKIQDYKSDNLQYYTVRQWEGSILGIIQWDCALQNYFENEIPFS